MKRRDVIAGLLVAAAIGRWAHAQQTTKVYRIAIVSSSAPVSAINESNSFYGALFGELRRLGYGEGQNLVVERYSTEGQLERYPEIVSDVVRSSPDVVFAAGQKLLLDLKAQTTTIPIVAWAGDPVAWGFAESLAHPGGNIT